MVVFGPACRNFTIFSVISKRCASYYAILGLDRSATASEIKKAYYVLSKKYHPDKNPNNEKMHNKFLELQTAYETLGNEIKRRNYDTRPDIAGANSNETRSNYSDFYYKYKSTTDPNMNQTSSNDGQEQLFKREIRMLCYFVFMYLCAFTGSKVVLRSHKAKKQKEMSEDETVVNHLKITSHLRDDYIYKRRKTE